MYLRGALPPTTGYLLYLLLWMMLYFLSGAEQSKRWASMYLWTLHYIICLCRPTLTSLSLGPPTMTISCSLWHTWALVSQLHFHIHFHAYKSAFALHKISVWPFASVEFFTAKRTEKTCTAPKKRIFALGTNSSFSKVELETQSGLDGLYPFINIIQIFI